MTTKIRTRDELRAEATRLRACAARTGQDREVSAGYQLRAAELERQAQGPVTPAELRAQAARTRTLASNITDPETHRGLRIRAHRLETQADALTHEPGRRA